MQIKEEEISQQPSFLTEALVVCLQEINAGFDDGMIRDDVMQILPLTGEPHLL